MSKTIDYTTRKSSAALDVDIDQWPGRMLMALRENLGYERDYIAEQLGIGIGTIAQYESGKQPMPSETISRAATFFEVLPSAFFKKVNRLGDVDEVLDKIADDYCFEQLLCRLNRSQRRKLINIAHSVFMDDEHDE